VLDRVMVIARNRALAVHHVTAHEIQDRLAVSLDRRGRLLAGQRVLSGAETPAFWAGQAKARRAGLELLPSDPNHPGPGAPDLPTVVIVRADRDVSYANLRRTLGEAQEQGFARFSLVVLRREEP